ncbi:MAG: GNAT family N-acetyltransferase [Fibrobacter sp.]|nr:GNAT family N-acetyltransferase [Fibrobacter sp.]MBR2898185.1 GNAT family N-acetyltransferase [Fibrobacter sp.]
MVQESIEKYRFIRLNENNVVESFDCGDQDLNDFILNRSTAYQKYLLSVSYAFANPDNGKILAYCSLANDKVAVTDFKDKTEFNRFRRHHGFPNAKRLKSYPAVKLCRLGVDTSAKGKQIGTRILNYIKSMYAMENKAGCRFLTVDAYLGAIPFYIKNDFQFMNAEDTDPHTRMMYFDLKDIVD